MGTGVAVGTGVSVGTGVAVFVGVLVGEFVGVFVGVLVGGTFVGDLVGDIVGVFVVTGGVVGVLVEPGGVVGVLVLLGGVVGVFVVPGGVVGVLVEPGGGVLVGGTSQSLPNPFVSPARLTPFALILTSTCTRPQFVQFGILKLQLNPLLVAFGLESLIVSDPTLLVECPLSIKSEFPFTQTPPSDPEHQNHDVSLT